jgi:hypothetical protein
MERESRQVVDFDRFNQIGYHIQRDRIKALVDKWGVEKVLAEDNNMSETIHALYRDGVPVEGFHTTAATKPPLIEALILAFQHKSISILDNPVLISELEMFEAKRLPAGYWRYEAPSGMHDDTVIALALAYEIANRPKFVGLVTAGSRSRK